LCEKIMCPPNSRVALLQLKSDPTKFEEGRRQGFLIAQLFYYKTSHVFKKS
jgi:hypothetical protein